MALDFPANPTNGQVYDSYVYNSTVGAWQAREDSATVAITSPTAPATANNGDIWYNSNTGVSYVYYADGTSAQWVEIVSSAVPALNSKANVDSPTFTTSVTGPYFHATSNGAGTNFRVGDDVWIGDVDIANTMSIRGVANAANAYIQFGSADNTVLGRAGSGALTYGGNTVWHAGNDGASSGLDADLLDGNHASAFSLTSHTHDDIVSKGVLSAETGRSVHDSGVYTFNTNNSSLGDSTPVQYWSTLAWGRGAAGSAELAATWTSSGTELWYRSLRDVTDNWWAWKKINHSGTINTAPLQPSFLATKSDNGSAYSGDYVFNIAMHNTGGYYSTSTGRFTAPVAGRYYFVAEAQTYGVGAGTLSTISFKKNGTLYMDSSGGTPKTIVNKAVDATYHNTIVLAMVIDCAANDYVTVFTENTRGMQSHFSGYLIG